MLWRGGQRKRWEREGYKNWRVIEGIKCIDRSLTQAYLMLLCDLRTRIMTPYIANPNLFNWGSCSLSFNLFAWLIIIVASPLFPLSHASFSSLFFPVTALSPCKEIVNPSPLPYFLRTLFLQLTKHKKKIIFMQQHAFPIFKDTYLTTYASSTIILASQTKCSVYLNNWNLDDQSGFDLWYVWERYQVWEYNLNQNCVISETWRGEPKWGPVFIPKKRVGPWIS